MLVSVRPEAAIRIYFSERSAAVASVTFLSRGGQPNLPAVHAALR